MFKPTDCSRKRPTSLERGSSVNGTLGKKKKKKKKKKDRKSPDTNRRLGVQVRRQRAAH
ncbi:hypothetical protein HBI55_163450 [Parastagonospora nodorum]|nr:hypothetical protein HBH49_175030 [Parastagonospora nodorum]KAH5095059.1 hypothetical protein HBH72_157850 [Parastagonospora nodorum]KAH5295777.1 hypothetical protein HBI11_172860 [Parastagonospora nodorum]KAH5744816.1 hypothetical protein HBI17_151180 [Parastagonospora nodorum]KAH6258286.1 hypothetical protein HBI41_150350 [Parastagonospora nodorum]